jgi:DNA-binding beta-propeller fold protein YncE
MKRTFVLLMAVVAVLSSSSAADQDKMYWSDFGADRIARANLDGSDVEVVAGGMPIPHGVALDMVGRKVYWTDSRTDTIYSADLDGSSPEELVHVQPLPGANSTLRGIALDPAGGKMYWADATDYGHVGLICKANLDGSEIEEVVQTNYPDDLALDVVGGKMYWNDFANNRIRRCNLDGTDVETIISQINSPYGLALNLRDGQIYYNDKILDGVWKRRIMRADLDGSNIEPLITDGLNDVRGIALDLSANKMYWADLGDKSLSRANLDGSEIENLITSGLSFPNRIAITPEPATLALLTMGSLALLQRRKCRTCKQ